MDSVTFDLFEGAQCGRKDDVALAIAFGANVNARNAIGFTPLMYACWRGFAPVVDLLLRIPGVDVGAKCPEGLCAAHFAASACPSKADDDAVAVLKLLQAAGADLNARTSLHGDTPIMRAIASNLKGVVAFLAAAPGCDLGAVDGAGRGLAQWCEDYGSVDCESIIRTASSGRRSPVTPSGVREKALEKAELT